MAAIASSNWVRHAGEWFTWRKLADSIGDRAGDLTMHHSRRLMFAVSDELEAVSIVAAGVEANLDFGVVERSRLNNDLRDRLADEGILLLEIGDSLPPTDVDHGSRAQAGRISVLTSGTTGLPKLVHHTAESLNTFDRVRNLRPSRWFVPYQIGSYAWYQMVALGLFVEGQGLVLGQSGNLMGSFEEALRSACITAVSSTPTFWRQAAMSVAPEAFDKSDINSISLGGEIVDQAILDYLKIRWPNATIRHIYASSETGAAIVVSDGKAGFDAGLLNTPDSRSVVLRIVDGRLHVRSRYGNQGAVGTWIDTGDLVEQVGDRVYFRGRANNQLINVGGQKVYPAVIEARLLAHPDVVWAQVVAKRAPLMGYLPVANVVLRSGADPARSETDLARFCEAGLPEYAVPKLWNFLDAVPLQASLKS